MTDGLRRAHRFLAASGGRRSRFQRGRWSPGYLAEQIGPTMLVHWFGSDRSVWLPRCEQSLVEAGFTVEHIKNAAGDDALSVKP